MKMKILISGLIFSVVLNIAVIGTYVFRSCDYRPPDDVNISPPFPDSYLNEDQRQKMKELFFRFHDQNKSIMDQILAHEEEIFAMLRRDSVSLNSIDSVISEISSLKQIQSSQAIKMFLESRKFLTKEQQYHFFKRMIKSRPGRPFRDQKFRQFRNRTDRNPVQKPQAE